MHGTGARMTTELLLVTPVISRPSKAAGTWGADSHNVSFSVVFVAATPGIKVERIKGIVKCPSHPPLLPSEKRGPLSLHGFYCHNPYSFN